jgi:hypothetical protein
LLHPSSNARSSNSQLDTPTQPGFIVGGLMLGTRTNSSARRITLKRRVEEAAHLTVALLKKRERLRGGLESYEQDVTEYASTYRRFTGKEFSRLNTLELGFGQRPYRLFLLQALAHHARGIDMDEPMLRPSLRKAASIWRRNGPERALKTLVRKTLLDRGDWQQFQSRLDSIAGGSFSPNEDALIIDDIANLRTRVPAASVDFLYSEDVFEHIDASNLSAVCSAMKWALRPEGLAFVRPMIFTGLLGGHNVEWYDASTIRKRTCPPWDHLRRHDYPANTFLNGLRRSDYRQIFGKHFEILDEEELMPGLGRQYMTPTLRAELSEYSDSELYSNWVTFILRPKT